MSEPKPWKHPKYDVMYMADDDIALASVAKIYKSEMLLAVAEVERLRAEVERLNSELHTCSCANAKMNMHMNENARLKAEVERLTKAIMDSVEMRQRLREIENGNQSK